MGIAESEKIKDSNEQEEDEEQSAGDMSDEYKHPVAEKSRALFQDEEEGDDDEEDESSSEESNEAALRRQLEEEEILRNGGRGRRAKKRPGWMTQGSFLSGEDVNAAPGTAGLQLRQLERYQQLSARRSSQAASSTPSHRSRAKPRLTTPPPSSKLSASFADSSADLDLVDDDEGLKPDESGACTPKALAKRPRQPSLASFHRKNGYFNPCPGCQGVYEKASVMSPQQYSVTAKLCQQENWSMEQHWLYLQRLRDRHKRKTGMAPPEPLGGLRPPMLCKDWVPPKGGPRRPPRPAQKPTLPAGVSIIENVPRAQPRNVVTKQNTLSDEQQHTFSEPRGGKTANASPKPGKSVSSRASLAKTKSPRTESTENTAWAPLLQKAADAVAARDGIDTSEDDDLFQCDEHNDEGEDKNSLLQFEWMEPWIGIEPTPENSGKLKNTDDTSPTPLWARCLAPVGTMAANHGNPIKVLINRAKILAKDPEVIRALEKCVSPDVFKSNSAGAAKRGAQICLHRYGGARFRFELDRYKRRRPKALSDVSENTPPSPSLSPLRAKAAQGHFNGASGIGSLALIAADILGGGDDSELEALPEGEKKAALCKAAIVNTVAARSETVSPKQKPPRKRKSVRTYFQFAF